MKNKIVLIIIFSLIIIGLAAFAIFSLKGFNDGYAIKIGDDIKVSPGEYMVYLYEQKKHFEETGGADIWETDIDGVLAEDLAKQNAIDTVIDVKVATCQADKFNIELSEEEFDNAKSESERFFGELGSEWTGKFDVTYDDVKKIIEDGFIRTKVFDYVTGGYTIDDKEFEEYFKEYFNENKADLVDMRIKYIFKGFNKDKSDFDKVYDEMSEILLKARGGEDFDTLIKEYSERNEHTEVEMKKGLFESAVDDVVCDMSKKGDISDIIAVSNGFYIVYASDVNPIDISSVKQAEKENYIRRKKDELYRRQAEKWLNSFTVEKNDEVFSSVNIKDI